jgi:hypothetical protein
MPAIGKFRPALQSMDATVPGFHRVTPQGNLGPKSNRTGRLDAAEEFQCVHVRRLTAHSQRAQEASMAFTLKINGAPHEVDVDGDIGGAGCGDALD